MQKSLYLSLFLLIGFGMNAQELGLHFMDNVYQSNFTNPAKISNSRIHVGLPSFIMNYGHNGPTLGSMLTTNANGEDIIDIDAGLAKLDDNNFFRTEIGMETFNFGMKFNKLQVGVSHAVRSGFMFGYPRELPEMAFNGNVQYIDETVDVGFGTDMTVYGELAFHGAYQVTPKLSLGARVKVLSGVGNVSTSSSREQISIYTDPEYYQLTATTDYQINSAGEFFDMEIITTADSTDFNLSGGNVSATDFFFGGNSGIGFDFGAEYQLSDKIKLGFSVLDIGSINWTKNSSNFISNGSYTFEGVNADDAFFGDDSLDFDGIVDTMVQILGFEETNNSYKTQLVPKFYFSGSYDISETLSAGAVFYGDIARERFRPAIALSVQKQFGKIFSLGGVYAIRNNTYDNVGLNFALNLGAFQLYGVSDNVVSVFRPLNTKSVNFRVGMNIAVGKKKEKTVDELE